MIDRLKKSIAEKNEIEDDDNLMRRFRDFLEKISRANIGKTVLIVTHAGAMRTFLVRLNWGIYKFNVRTH